MAAGAALISIGAVGATLWLPQSHWAVTPSPSPREQNTPTGYPAQEQDPIFAQSKRNSVLDGSTVAALASPTSPTTEVALELAIRQEAKKYHHSDLPDSIPPHILDRRRRHHHHHGHHGKPPSQLPQPDTSLLIGVGLCFMSRVKPKIHQILT